MSKEVGYIKVMRIVTLTYKIMIQASQQKTFDYVSDWEKQSDWILFTTVKNLSNATDRVKPRLLATTSFGLLKFVDTMIVTEWLPHEKIVVEHTGRIILGKGVFTIVKTSPGSCKFMWQEITPVPFGIVGQVGLVLIKPVMKILFTISLKKLKRSIESSL